MEGRMEQPELPTSPEMSGLGTPGEGQPGWSDKAATRRVWRSGWKGVDLAPWVIAATAVALLLVGWAPPEMQVPLLTLVTVGSLAVAAAFASLTLRAKSASLWLRGGDRLAEELCDRVISSNLQGLAIVDLVAGRCVFVNEALGRLTGYTEADLREILSSGLEALVVPADLARLRALLTSAAEVAGGPPLEAELRLRRADGETIGCRFRAAGLGRSGSGNGVHVAVSLVEATEPVEALPPSSSGSWFRHLADAAPAMLWMGEPDGRSSFRSRGWSEQTGQSEPEGLGLGWLEAVHPEDREPSIGALRRAAAERRPFVLEYRLRRADGAYRWAMDTARPRFDAAGVFLGYVGSVVDVHERQLAEAALRSSAVHATKVAKETITEREELLRGLTEALPDPVFAKDRDGRILLANSACLKALGRTRDEVLGRTDLEWHPNPEEAAVIVENDRRVMDSGVSERVEEAVTTSAGIRVYAGTKAPLRDASGAVIGLVGVLRDVTEQRAAERALKESAERLRLALLGGGMGMWDFDITSDRVVWSERQRELWGIEFDDTDGNASRVFNAIHPADRAAVEASCRAAARGEIPLFKSEFRVVHPDGSVRWLVGHGSLAEGSAGRRLIGVNYDVTARKATEETLRCRERELQTLADNSPDILTRFDRTLRHVFVNAAVERVTGRPRASFLGRTNRELGMPLHLCDHWEAIIGRVFVEKRAQQFEFRFDGPEGTRFFEARFVPELDPNGEVEFALGVTRDRTAEKAVADALRAAEERFQLALRRAPVILFNQDRELRYTWLHNPVAPLADGIGLKKTDAELFPEEDARRLMALKAEVIRSGRGIRQEVAVGVAGDLLYYDLTVEPIWDANGEVRGIACAALDISSLKRAEAELRETDRRKDEFLATLAHELRNPLAPIRTGLEVLRLASSQDARAIRILDTMDRQLTHLVRLIDDLMDVSRISRGKLVLKKEPVTLRSVVEAAVEAAQPLVDARRHELEVRLPDVGVRLEADPSRLSQVVSNLLNNAAKYTPEGGRIELDARLDGREVVLSVQDTGIGLARDMLDRVFEMFVQIPNTSDESRSGLGLGLALVRRLVEMHGGQIEADSAGPGQGSTFTVRLPAAAMAEPERSDARATATLAGNGLGRRILIVDDNVDAAESLAELLRLIGHEVLTAHDGPAALASIRALRPEVGLLDIGLPGMDGYELAERLRQDAATASAFLIAVTGWGSEKDKRRAREAGFDLHLTKPIDASAVQDVVARLPRPDPTGQDT